MERVPSKTDLGWVRFLVFALVAIAGAFVLPSQVLGGDNAEFVTLSLTGGVAHPPGYPVYVSWLQLLSSILPHSFAAPTTAAFATLLIYVAALLLLDRALQTLGSSAPAALSVTVLIGVTPLIFTLGTHAEVFSLLLLNAALVLYAAGKRSVLWMAVAFALGAAHHHSLVWLLPLVMTVLPSRAELRTTDWWHVLILALGCGLAVAIIPYAFLWWQSHRSLDAALVWRPLHSLDDLLHHVLRSDYGSTQLFRGAGGASPFIHVPGLLIDVLDAIRVGPVLLVAFAFRKDQSLPSKRMLGLLSVCWMLCGPVFFAMFNAPPSSFTTLFTERFVALPLWMLSPFLALGLTNVLERIPTRWGLLLPFVFLLLQLPRAYDAALQHHEDNTESLARHTLQALPQDAVLMMRGDQHVFAVAYLQKGLGLRPDVIATGLEAFHVQAHAARLNARTESHAFDMGLPLGNSIARLNKHEVFVSPSLAGGLERVGLPTAPCGMAFAVRQHNSSTRMDHLMACDHLFYEAMRAVPPIHVFPESPDGWAALNADEVAFALRVLAARWEGADQTWLSEMRLDDASLFAPWE